MVQRAGIFSLMCFMFCAGISSIEAGKWTNWRDITLCNAMPCKCPGNTENKGCKLGKKYQIRGCIVGSDGRACQYDDGHGPIKTADCINNNAKLCPGWSEWSPSKCEQQNGMRVETRYCNDPAPIHPKIKCVNKAGEEALTEEQFVDCKYVAPTTVATTAASTVSTTTLPCCPKGSTVDPSVETTSTTPPPDSSTSFDYDSLWCDPNKPCEGDESDSSYDDYYEK